jgi:hypothetical protein
VLKADEEWRDIPGYEGSYQASSWGRIKGVGRIVYSSSGNSGWPRFVTVALASASPVLQGGEQSLAERVSIGSPRAASV